MYVRRSLKQAISNGRQLKSQVIASHDLKVLENRPAPNGTKNREQLAAIYEAVLLDSIQG